MKIVYNLVPLLITALVSFGFIQQAVPPATNATAKPGEISAKDFSIEWENRRIELDGVCKFTEDSALCWKPDGSANPILTEKLNSAIRNPRNSSRNRYFEIAPLKKKRYLFVKEMTLGGSNNPFIGASTNYEGFPQDWKDNSTLPFSAYEQSFDRTLTTWVIKEGTFQSDDTESSIKYQLSHMPEEPIIQKCQLGRFQIEGNTFEITEIKNHDPAIDVFGGFGGGSGPAIRPTFTPPPPAKTDIVIKVVRLPNPFISMEIRLGDVDGKEISAVDKNDNSISVEEVNRWNKENKVYEPGNHVITMAYNAPGGCSFDPRSPYYSKNPITLYLRVAKENCKNLLFTTTQHKAYVFEHIKLDPVKQR